MSERDIFVGVLKLMIKGWLKKQDELKPEDASEKKDLELQTLIRKTNIFLQNEFGEKNNI